MTILNSRPKNELTADDFPALKDLPKPTPGPVTADKIEAGTVHLSDKINVGIVYLNYNDLIGKLGTPRRAYHDLLNSFGKITVGAK